MHTFALLFLTVAGSPLSQRSQGGLRRLPTTTVSWPRRPTRTGCAVRAQCCCLLGTCKQRIKKKKQSKSSSQPLCLFNHCHPHCRVFVHSSSSSSITTVVRVRVITLTTTTVPTADGPCGSPAASAAAPLSGGKRSSAYMATVPRQHRLPHRWGWKNPKTM